MTEQDPQLLQLGVADFAKARAKLPKEQELRSGRYFAESKLDGSRYRLCCGFDPYKRHQGTAILSRRLSVKDNLYVDRYENVPHITDLINAYTWSYGHILDGEFVVPGHDLYTITGMMNSLPSQAVSLQEHNHPQAVYYIFDVLAFKGKDTRTQPQWARTQLARDIIASFSSPFFRLPNTYNDNFDGAFEKEVLEGGEGLIIKHKEAAYGKGWAKMKKSYEVQCFISGYIEGEGKYAGQIGAIRLSIINADGPPTEVATASGMTDAVRLQISDHRDDYINSVVDVYAQEWTGDRLRHPTFVRFREDLSSLNCTREAFESALHSEKAKGQRTRD